MAFSSDLPRPEIEEKGNGRPPGNGGDTSVLYSPPEFKEETSNPALETPFDPLNPVFSNNFDTNFFPPERNLIDPATRNNYESRLTTDLFTFLGFPALIGTDLSRLRSNPLDPNAATEVQAAALAIDNLAGLGLGYVLHKIFMYFDIYEDRKSLNPFYRNFKTLASIGLVLGTLITNMISMEYIHIPDRGKKFLIPIISNSIAFGLGLFAFPYWLIRRYVLKIDPRKNETYHITWIDGPSKYVKTALVQGVALGQAIGGLVSHFTRGSLQTSIVSLYGGLVGIGSAVLTFALVPTINYISQKLWNRKILKADTSENKNSFRNNYVRSGITLGAAIGSAVGFLLGTLLFPGVGSTLGALLGGAIGSCIGGPTLAVLGCRITGYLEKKWDIGKDTNNSWDYAARTTSYAFSSYGALIGFAIGVAVIGTGGGALAFFMAGAAGCVLGNYIAASVGWFAGLGVTWVARKIQKEENDAETLPWTQRVGGDVKRFSLLGTAIGALCGIPLGPAGMLITAMVGNAIGGIFGSIYGTLKDKETRTVVKKGLGMKVPDEAAQTSVTASDTPAEQPRPSTAPVADEKPTIIAAPTPKNPENPSAPVASSSSTSCSSTSSTSCPSTSSSSSSSSSTAEASVPATPPTVAPGAPSTTARVLLMPTVATPAAQAVASTSSSATSHTGKPHEQKIINPHTPANDSENGSPLINHTVLASTARSTSKSPLCRPSAQNQHIETPPPLILAGGGGPQ